MEREFAQLQSAIKQRKKWLVISHANPDGDALSSTLAMRLICEAWGMEVTCISPSPLPEKYQFLPGINEVLRPQEIDQPADAVIMVDCADRERIGKEGAICMDDGAFIINIDHHATNQHYGDVNLVQPQAAATAQILYQWIESSPEIEWNEALATCVYTGIMDDTGGFRYSNTTTEVMNAAAKLLSLNVPAAKIADQVLETLTQKNLKLLKIALDRLYWTDDGQVAWMSLEHESLATLQAGDGDLDGIVNYARNIAGVDVGILFWEKEPGLIRVSLRSRALVNVAEVARSFNGGGHIRAAGCTVHGTLDEAIRRVVRRVQSELGV